MQIAAYCLIAIVSPDFQLSRSMICGCRYSCSRPVKVGRDFEQEKWTSRLMALDVGVFAAAPEDVVNALDCCIVPWSAIT